MVSARRGVAIIIIAHCRRPQGRYRSRSTGYVNLGMMIDSGSRGCVVWCMVSPSVGFFSSVYGLFMIHMSRQLHSVRTASVTHIFSEVSYFRIDGNAKQT